MDNLSAKSGNMVGMVNSERALTRDKPHTAGVGNERKADMKGGMSGMPSDGLKGAIGELKKQHPFAHDDTKTHHNDMSHVRHEPLAGMKPASGKY